MRSNRNVLLLAAVAMVPSQLAAQLVPEVTPYAGAYHALSPTIELADGTSATQQTALLLGARLTMAPLGIVGLEGSVAWSPSNVEATAPATGGSASLFLVSARAIFNLIPLGPAGGLYAAAGGGVVARSGDFYQGLTGTTSFGGNVALGVRLGLGGVVKLRLEVEDFIYSVSLESAGGAATDSKLQNDLAGTVALSLPIG